MPVDSPFIKYPELETERLRLRQIKESDVGDFFSIKSDSDLTAKYGQKPHAEIGQTSRWIEGVLKSYSEKNALFWVITLKGADRAIGGVTLWNLDLESFCGELGYELHRNYWRQGISSEAISAVLDYGFHEMGLNRIEACPLEENSPSKKLLEKFGFRCEGNHRQRIYFDGEFKDQLYYSLLKDEWSLGKQDLETM